MAMQAFAAKRPPPSGVTAGGWGTPAFDLARWCLSAVAIPVAITTTTRVVRVRRRRTRAEGRRRVEPRLGGMGAEAVAMMPGGSAAAVIVDAMSAC